MEFPGGPNHHHVHHHYHHHHHHYYNSDDERLSGNVYPPPQQQPAPFGSQNEFAVVHHYPAPPSAPPPPPPKTHQEETTTQAYLASKPTSKVYCKANPDFHLTVRDGKLVLAPSDPSDPCQNWFKDEEHGNNGMKDEQGYPCFALVNQATSQAMSGYTNPVQLVPYNNKPDDVVDDHSVMWSLGRDEGGGYRAMRMAKNIRMNVEAFRCIEELGGVHDGNTIVLWDWNEGDNQLWKIDLQ
ncbi:unnamed protein product [Linum trigynum]|uniref:Uncharacterized protein n=1 Tax=Linum trigynum TaxID=586398 RepID=A0AAV2C8Z5_9ROSI